MILPSDETPGKPEEPEDDFAWAQGDVPEEMISPFSADPYEGPPGGVEHPAPPGWREDLQRSIAEALRDLAAIEDPDEDLDPPEPPDLFTFYGELAALRNEVRRGHKKLADGVQKISTTTAATAPALELVALSDALAGTTHAELVLAALQRAGIEPLRTAAGQAFDAATMTPAGGKNPAKALKIKAVLRPGYTWQGRVLRPALVEV